MQNYSDTLSALLRSGSVGLQTLVGAIALCFYLPNMLDIAAIPNLTMLERSSRMIRGTGEFLVMVGAIAVNPDSLQKNEDRSPTD